MKTTSIRARALACALLAGTAYCGLTAEPAAAQTAFPLAERQAPDENGVDVISGKINVPLRSISAGNPGQSGLTYALGWAGGSFYDSFSLSALGVATNEASVTLFGNLKRFTKDASGNFTPVDADGTTLTHDPASGITTLTMRDGTIITFKKLGLGIVRSHAQTVTRPDGEVITYHHRFVPGGCSFQPCTLGKARVQSITSNLGYMLKAGYASNVGSDSDFTKLATVDAINSAVDYCDPDADSCTGLSQTWPRLSLADSTSGSTTTQTFTDNLSQTTRIVSNATGVIEVTSPADPAADMAVGYDADGRVSSLTRGAGTWGYSYADSGNQRTTTVTQPLGGWKAYVSDLDLKRVLSITDELGRTTSFGYDGFGRPKRTTLPEGNYTELTYDGRGNPTQTTNVAKSVSGLASIVTSASYDATCSNSKTCNRPNSTTDARGNITNYSYDPNHGGLRTVTLPAPSAGAVRPEARYTYSALTAYYKNSSGAIAAAPSAVYRLTAVSACRTGASCDGTADEAKTIVAYGSAGVANNLLATATTSGDGTGALAATTAVTYDNVGNVLTVDGPLAGVADTVRHRWDSDRRLVGSVSPDPDGDGPMKMRAQRIAYDGDGNVTKVERGTVRGQSDSDWGEFAPAEAVETDYDTLGRPVTRRLTAGATTHALTQTSYDARGRAECSAQRMDPNDFDGALPDACTPTSPAGGFGPDRIVRTGYDSASQVVQVRTALGVAGEETDEAGATYSDNGLTRTLKDGENNLTTFEYDGHDRLLKTFFPNITKGAGTSSTTDFEQLGYDANGNVTSFRNRAAETIGFGYDGLDRVTSKDLPGTEPDATFAYDLLGNLLSATQNGVAIAFTYDALGRQLTQTIPIASISNPIFTSDYDLAGRRTRLSWPVDASSPTAYYADYDYLVTGEMAAVREKGATSGIGVLAAYGYDDLGRRTSLTRGNGTGTSYVYDDVSRLSRISHDFGGSATTHDLTLTYAYNPASQIVSTTRSNDLYAWTGHGSGTLVSSADGLNRLASHGGATPTYDARGNLISDGSFSYTYSSENLMISGANSGTLGYDPLMRFYQSGTVYFVHDSDGQLIGDYYNGNIVGRYVPGAAHDEPVAQVTKTGARSWYHADERGSVIAGSNNGGVNERIVTYDENGRRGGNLSYRFAFTGQVVLINDVYDYKTRNYNARLPRFLQTDRIGLGGGMNVYLYAGGDPVNFSDPLGLKKKKKDEDNDTIVVTAASHFGMPMGGGGRGGGGGTRAVLLAGPYNSPNVSCTSEDCWDVAILARKRSRQWAIALFPLFLPIPNFLSAYNPDPDDACGSKGSDRVPDVVGGADLTSACLRHDRCYASTRPKGSCDTQFLTEVKDACMETRVGPIPCYGLGTVYFLGVSLGGGAAYRVGHPQ